jgi:hypothetical protein
LLAAKKLTNSKTLLKANNKSKAVWNIIKQETANVSKKHQETQIKSKDVDTSDPKELANFVNEYFSSIAMKLQEKFPDTY